MTKETETANLRPTWGDFPYTFNPKKTMTTKELTEVLRYFFAVKPVSKEFVQALPKDLQQHFSLRDDAEAQPSILKGKTK